MQHWRYKVLVIRELALSEAKLNAEGEKGWELVSIAMESSTTARAFLKKLYDPETDPHPAEHGEHALVSSH
jgi:hypothetical protein